MKKIVTLLAIFIFFSAENKAQYVDIPDGAFKYLLQQKYPECFNAGGQMDTTCSSIINEDSLNINRYATIGTCSSIDGMQYFKNLTYLDFYGQFVTNIPSFPASLLYINCSENGFLQNLPALPRNLIYLDCSGCSRLQRIPSLPNSLRYLDYKWCSQLTSLVGRLPDSLVYLNCYYTNVTMPPFPITLKYLNIGSNTNIASYLTEFPPFLDTLICNGCYGLSNLPPLPATLKYLDCGLNSISTLPATLPDSLQYLNFSLNDSIATVPPLPGSLRYLDCSGNNIRLLPGLPQTLLSLNCSRNPLYNLPELPDSLQFLSCNSDSITHLPVLPGKIARLECSRNQLTSLPDLPQNLTYLDCSYNFLSALPAIPLPLWYIICSHNDIHCLPYLPEFSESGFNLTVEVDSNKINCISNNGIGINIVVRDELHGMVLPIPNPPLCTPANNINRCQSFPVISGNVFFDNNNNGIKDTNENYKPNVKFELSNGGIAYTDNNGHFEIGTNSLGSYTITPTAPNYYNIAPSTATYLFNTYDTIVSKDYALQANTIKDSLAIKLTPVNWAARPGFSFPYIISYENAGTSTLSPDIVFSYDDTKLTYDSSSNAAVVNNGNSLYLNVVNFELMQQQNFTAYFKVKPTVALGDSLFAKATINYNTATAADSNKTFIRGSFDPNDKQATPELSPLQVFNGSYIDYTIRFQNTGTDTAFNVVISDILNEDLQVNTLQIVSSSHNCKTTIKDNTVFFEFLNLLLPDSNVNEMKSHGFVSFRIKPQTTVGAGTTIPNNAAIYFDYNAPVITNTASTFIQPFTVVPVKLLSFNAVPQTGNATILYWNTANEINTQYFVIEQSTDGTRFNSVANVLAKRRANNNYSTNVADRNHSLVYYRLKIVDNDGSFVYSPIIKIDKRKNAAGFSILSNPVKDFIIINTTDRSLNNTQATIINIQGAVVKTFIVKEGSQTVEIKGLPAGIYYLQSINGSQKIVIR